MWNEEVNTAHSSYNAASGINVDTEDLSDEEGISSYTIKNPRLNIPTGIINLINTIACAGILELPYAFTRMRWFVCLPFFGLLWGNAYYSTTQLIRCKNLTQRSKFTSIAEAAFGSKGEKAIKIIIALLTIGMTITYAICFYVTMISMVDTIFFPSENSNARTSKAGAWYFLLGYCALLTAVLLPFIFKKSIHSTTLISGVGCFSILVFCVFIIVNFFVVDGKAYEPEPSDTTPVKRILYGLGTVPSIFISLTFQLNVYPVYKNLHRRSDEKMYSIVLVTILVILPIYLSIGFFGSFTYGFSSGIFIIDSVQVKTSGQIIFYGVHILLLFASCMTLPLMFILARNYSLSLLYDVLERKTVSLVPTNPLDPSSPRKVVTQVEELSPSGFRAFSGLLLLCCLGLACVYPTISIKVWSNVIGSVCCTSVAFIFPGACYLKLTSKRRIHRKLSIAMVAFGCLMTVVCFTAGITDFVLLFTDPKSPQP